MFQMFDNLFLDINLEKRVRYRVDESKIWNKLFVNTFHTGAYVIVNSNFGNFKCCETLRFYDSIPFILAPLPPPTKGNRDYYIIFTVMKS